MLINFSLKICAGGEGKDACDGEGGAPLVCLDKVRYYFFLAATSYLTIWCFCFCSKLFLQTRDQYFVVGLVNYGFTCSGILFHEQDFDCYCKSWFPCQSLQAKPNDMALIILSLKVNCLLYTSTWETRTSRSSSYQPSKKTFVAQQIPLTSFEA